MVIVQVIQQDEHQGTAARDHEDQTLKSPCKSQTSNPRLPSQLQMCAEVLVSMCLCCLPHPH